MLCSLRDGPPITSVNPGKRVPLASPSFRFLGEARYLQLRPGNEFPPLYTSYDSYHGAHTLRTYKYIHTDSYPNSCTLSVSDGRHH
jgi:hypothetical protein